MKTSHILVLSLHLTMFFSPSEAGANGGYVISPSVLIQRVTNTAGGHAVRLSGKAPSNPLLEREMDLVSARHEFSVLTEFGGYCLLLYAPTNCFSESTQVEVSLMVLNCTTVSSPMIRWAGERPLFGGCVVSNIATGMTLKPHSREQSIMSVSGGSLLPLNHRRFRLNLMDYFARDDRGIFTVRFRGVLPSILVSGEEVEFETPALMFTIEPSKPVATNVSGWRVELELPKTNHTAGMPIVVHLTIQNTTERQREFGYSRGGIWAMGIGQYEVVDVRNGQPVKGPLDEEQIHNAHASMLDPLPPAGRKDFYNDLTEGFSIKKPGDYRVRFHAKLPATSALKGPTVEFETPPLMFTIEPSKPVATNAPPRKPDSK